MAETNELARVAILFSLGKIPEAGELISGLVGVLWPAPTQDVWNDIRARAEALVNKKIADFHYQLVSEDLAGLKNLLHDYTTFLTAAAGKDPTGVTAKYMATLSHFEVAKPHFMATGSELLLLPLFAQFANLHLALLRDGVTFGPAWKWSPAEVAVELTKVKTAIQEYGDWARTWFDNGYNTLQLPSDSIHRMETWTTQNRYRRQMTLDVMDHAHFWPFFDPETNPGDVSKVRSPIRAIYSDPIGTADNTGIFIPGPPALPITGISIFAWNYIDAVQVAYGDVWGPRQGNQPTPVSGGSPLPPQGWCTDRINPRLNPIVGVRGGCGDVPDSMQLYFRDGFTTNVCGGLAPKPANPSTPRGSYDFSFAGHVLSSVHVMGFSFHYGCANCIVFGFRLSTGYDAAWDPIPIEPITSDYLVTIDTRFVGGTPMRGIRFEGNPGDTTGRCLLVWEIPNKSLRDLTFIEGVWRMSDHNKCLVEYSNYSCCFRRVADGLVVDRLFSQLTPQSGTFTDWFDGVEAIVFQKAFKPVSLTPKRDFVLNEVIPHCYNCNEWGGSAVALPLDESLFDIGNAYGYDYVTFSGDPDGPMPGRFRFEKVDVSELPPEVEIKDGVKTTRKFGPPPYWRMDYTRPPERPSGDDGTI